MNLPKSKKIHFWKIHLYTKAHHTEERFGAAVFDVR